MGSLILFDIHYASLGEKKLLKNNWCCSKNWKGWCKAQKFITKIGTQNARRMKEKKSSYPVALTPNQN